jgi:D-alanyl-D-alanine carboxypeptidase
VLLGALIERVTGHPAAAELRHRIFQPLHLDHTYVARDATIRGRHATGYTPLPDGGLRDVTRINATLTGDSGNMISTVSDVARFEHALISGRLLGRRALQQMLDVAAPVDDPPQNGYGLGIFTTPQACGTSYGHGGGIFGFSSEAQEMADGQRQSVAFVNSDDIPEGAYPHLAAAARLSLCGEP